jgi:hypothetical protein
MKIRPIVLSVALSMGLTSQGMASETGIFYKQTSSEDSSYCHIKYNAYTEQSLQTGQLEFNPSEVIDMYGPCNFDPTSREEVKKQVADFQRNRFGEGSNDSSGD